MHTPSTPAPGFRQRAESDPAPGRARLTDAAYLADLAASARTAASAAATAAAQTAAEATAPIKPSRTISQARDRRIPAATAAEAAARYLCVALAALDAVLNGRPLTPGDLEDVAAAYNAKRPPLNAAALIPMWASLNRPALPRLEALATGHADLDTAVTACRAHVATVYAAAERLGHAAACRGDETPEMRPDDEATVQRLPEALISLADALADAARYGHASV